MGTKRMIAALAVVGVLSMLVVIPRAAMSADAYWDRIAVKWDTTGTPLVKTIGDESDTVRTVKIDLTSVAWDVIDASTTVGAGIRVLFEVTGSNTATDTINYQVEKCVGSACNYAASYLAETATAYNAAASDGDAAGKFFTGFLQVDRDAVGVGNVWACSEIRLKVQGDQSGSSAKVSAVKVWLYAPWRSR